MSKKATSFALDLTLAADRQMVSATRPIDRGALVALVITPITDVGRKGDTFVRAYIRTGGTEKTASQICLISDYCYQAYSAAWDGIFPLQENTSIVIEGWSGIAVTLRIAGTIDTEA